MNNKGEYSVVLEVDEDEYSSPQGFPNKTQGSNVPLGNPPAGPSDDRPVTQYPIWSIEYYSKYFDVDTTDVINRMFLTLQPKSNFLLEISGNPDLYGPFWISTTVIFLIFVTSSLSEAVTSYLAGIEHQYDFSMFWLAIEIIYIYVGGMSLIIWALTKYFGCQPKFLEIIDIYGYGMSIWIPITLFCVFSFDMLRWGLVLFGFGASVYFIAKHLFQIISRSDKTIHRSLVFLIITCHFILILLFKLQFYSYEVKPKSPQVENP